MSSKLSQSPFTNPDKLPLHPADAVAEFGSTLVVAPHPDDESLGCGGAIALLRHMGCPVRVLTISDGTRSHPNSRQYPAPALQALREDETKAALQVLGITAEFVTFLRLKDGSLPEPEAVGFERALTPIASYFETFKPETILLPWRHDPHPDHRATWHLIHTAIAIKPSLCAFAPLREPNPKPSPRLIEYPIWDWDPDQRSNNPLGYEVKAWRLDISTVLSQKQVAIAAHRSQTTDLIDDDPEGFRLTPEMLTHFTYPWEIYLEAACNG